MARKNALVTAQAGGVPVERRNATVEKVTQQLRAVPEMQVRAQAVAQAMRQEDGVVTAVRLIQRKFGRGALQHANALSSK